MKIRIGPHPHSSELRHDLPAAESADGRPAAFDECISLKTRLVAACRRATGRSRVRTAELEGSGTVRRPRTGRRLAALTLAAALGPAAGASLAAAVPPPVFIGGVNLGALPSYVMFISNGSGDANWQGATKGFVGDVAVNGVRAQERSSGGVPFAGTIFTNDSTLGAWQRIVDQNSGQASASFGQTTRINGLTADLVRAMQQINALPATAGYGGVSSTSLNGLNVRNSRNEVFVINITSGLGFSSKINVTGDAGDVFILRWDSDGNPNNGYQGTVKPQSGGAIVPLGGLTPANFINAAGDIKSSGGGSNPGSLYPQGPRFNDGKGGLIANGSNFSGGGFFTGYWLTTGSPSSFDGATGLYYGKTESQSNGIFVGGWYTLTDQFSLTSGTSAVWVSPNPATVEGAVQVCENAPDGTSFTFQLSNGQTVTVPAGGCSPVIPAPPGVPFTIVQQPKDCFALTAIDITPGRQISSNIGTKTAVVTIVTGGAARKTVATYTNVSSCGSVQVCENAPNAEPFTFTLSSGQTVTVPGGGCSPVFTVPPGTPVTITQQPKDCFALSAITATAGRLISSSIANRQAVVTIVDGGEANKTVATFTNVASCNPTGAVKVCEVALAGSSFTFDLSSGQTVTVPAGGCSPVFAVPPGVPVTITQRPNPCFLLTAIDVTAGRKQSVDLAQRTVTVTIVDGGVATNTVARFTNVQATC